MGADATLHNDPLGIDRGVSPRRIHDQTSISKDHSSFIIMQVKGSRTGEFSLIRAVKWRTIWPLRLCDEYLNVETVVFF